MSNSKITLVLGASINKSRYSNRCIRELADHGFSFEAIGLKELNLGDYIIKTGKPDLSDIHTVTIYLGPQNQPPYYQYILDLKPERVIFNPGTENPEFELMLENAGSKVIRACTIMMLLAGVYDHNSES